jgi:hypothetical protein
MRISTEPDLPVIRNSDRMREQVNIFPLNHDNRYNERRVIVY